MNEMFARRLYLASLTDIQNMAQYAQDWADLAADFERTGWMSNAEYCKERALHYQALADPQSVLVPGAVTVVTDNQVPA